MSRYWDGADWAANRLAMQRDEQTSQRTKRDFPLNAIVEFVSVRRVEEGRVDYAKVIGYVGDRLVLQIEELDFGEDGIYTVLNTPIKEVVDQQEVILSGV